MTGTFHVNTETVQQRAAQLNSTKGEFDEKLKKLQSLMNQLNTDFKSSKAAPAFQERYRQWNTSATNLNNALAAMSKFLGTVARETAQHDQNMAAQARRHQPQ